MKSIIKQRWYNYLIGLVFLLALFYELSNKLVYGARWASGMMLGGVDNFLEGGGLYTQPESAMHIGSIYSPAASFLALIARLLFGYNAETALIFLGGVIAVLLFWGYAFIESENKQKRYWFFITCGALFFLQFPLARLYLFEIHPDIPALMCFIWGIILIDRFLRSKKIITIILAIFLFLFSGLFKANALFLFVGLGFYTLLTKDFSKKEKLIVLSSEIIGGIGVIAIMITIDGCMYNCVYVMSKHPLISLHDYLLYSFLAFKNNMLFLALLLFFIVLIIRKKISFKSKTEKIWACCSVLWFLFGMYGTAKEGSNSGNVEASIICFMPFTLRVVEHYFAGFIFYIKHKFCNKGHNLLNYMLIVAGCVVCIGSVCFYTIKIGSNLEKFRDRINQQQSFANWINTNYKGCCVAYHARVYELLNNTEVYKSTDLHIASHYSLGGIINDEELKEVSKRESWDIVVTIKQVGANKWPITFENFTKLQDDSYPNVIVDASNVEVYVKK